MPCRVFNFLSSLASQCSWLWCEGSDMLPFFKLWTRVCNKPRKSYKIITFHQLAVFSDSKPYLFAVYHTSPGGGRKTHLQVESLLPRLPTDFSVIRSNQVWGFRIFGGLVSRVSGLVWYVFFRGQCLEMLGVCWAQLHNVNVCQNWQNHTWVTGGQI